MALPEMQLQLPDTEGDGAFEALATVNHRWLSRYARLHPSFSVEPALLERNSLWMNAFFQKSRMTTSASSPQASALLKKHRETVMERLRSAPLPHAESEFSTCAVDPMAALMFAASMDRCPHNNLEDLLAEAWELMQCAPIRVHANRSGFASCVFRFLTQFTETQKRISCLQLLVLLAEDDAAAVVDACKVAAQGQFWQPNMFVCSLQKRHQDNPTLCALAAKLMAFFSEKMPIPPPIVLERPSTRHGDGRQMFVIPIDESSHQRAATAQALSIRSPEKKNGMALPMLTNSPGNRSPQRALFSPTTTISKLYQEAPSPYCPNARLPLARATVSPSKQSQRATIFSMPRLAAVEGQRNHRCSTPNSLPTRDGREAHASGGGQPHRSLDPLFGSPPPSPDGSSPTKRPVIVSEKYSWNPECINSVSGFEWWWRSLPQNHSSLEPTQKLKMVTKAAVRLHAKGELQRAIELYSLALSSETNDEVEFRLRVNLACAYESNQALPSSIGEFRRALELNASDPYARYKLGCVLTSAGEFEAARRQFEMILDTYPQAKDGLKHLEDSLEQHRLEKEAERAATAAAKTRRSPAKPRPPMNGTTTKVREPAPPSTPGMQSSAPHRKKTPPTSLDHVTPAIGPSENNEHSCAVTPSQQRQQAGTAATLTESHAAPLNLLDLLVTRCQEVRIDMAKLLEKLDPQQRGLVHRESVAGLFRIIGGVELDGFSDEGTLTSLNITPDSWESKGNQVFLRYKGFLDAYTAKCRIGVSSLSQGEATQVKILLDDLVRNDVASLTHRSVTEWVSLGSKYAAAALQRPNRAAVGPREFDPSGPHSRLVSPHWLKRGSSGRDDDASMASGSDMLHVPNGLRLGAGTDGSQSAPTLGVTDGKASMTPRSRIKHEKAREEWLVVAEKTRVLARRHQHCMKSLRDIAARARAHVSSRRSAVAFLADTVVSARAELDTRKIQHVTVKHHDTMKDLDLEETPEQSTSSSPKPAPTANANNDGFYRRTIEELSRQTYGVTERVALAQLRRNAELQQVQNLANQLAGMCQVPLYFLELHPARKAPEGDEMQDSADGTMAADKV